MAAEIGDAEAHFVLGMMYAEGRGVTQDYVEAASGIAKRQIKALLKLNSSWE